MAKKTKDKDIEKAAMPKLKPDIVMTKQMEMFEEGGLKDEGGTVDEESGNDVPIGSTKEEVRDDIPAQLSEGEFVFPADVVRFIGLEKLMQMRQKAKMGLKKMEDMGQMGNSEEATIPDDMPFNIDDLDMEDEKEGEVIDSNFNRGGVVTMAEGGTTPTTVNTDQNNNVTINESNLNPRQASVPTRTNTAIPTQQRVTPIQKPLNVRQEAVPTRSSTASTAKTDFSNMPISGDFLKKKSFESTPTFDLESATPSNIGSRFNLSKKEATKIQKTEDIQKEFVDLGIAYNPNGQDGQDVSSPSQGTVGGNIDYSQTDILGLEPGLRDAYTDFTSAQLDMFAPVMSNPFSLAFSAISMDLGAPMGPVAKAEMGKAMATTFNTIASQVQRANGLLNVPNMSNWSPEIQNQVADKFSMAKDITQDLMAEKYGYTTSFQDKYGYSMTEKTISKAKGLFDTVLGKPPPDLVNVTSKQALTQFTDLVTSTANQALADKEANANAYANDAQAAGVAQAQTDAEAVEEENAFSGEISVSDLGALGFTQAAQDIVSVANAVTGQSSLNATVPGLGKTPSGKAYSINSNGTFTFSNGYTTNITHKGYPIEPPSTAPAGGYGFTSGGDYGLDPDTPAYGSVAAMAGYMSASSKSGYVGTLGNAINDARSGNKKAQKQLSILGINMDFPNQAPGGTPNDPNAEDYGVDTNPGFGTDPMGNPTETAESVAANQAQVNAEKGFDVNETFGDGQSSSSNSNSTAGVDGPSGESSGGGTGNDGTGGGANT